MPDNLLERLKNIIQDCHLNFLIGSGCSTPYIPTLGNTEILLSELSKDSSITCDLREIIRASILGKFFEEIVHTNFAIKASPPIEPELLKVLLIYQHFLTTINIILLKRKSSILNKQANLFTTNIDIFLEKALEEKQIEFNDGFTGRFNPIFSVANFKKSIFKQSLHYDNTSEIPLFNIFKIHGSLTWKTFEDNIYYSDLDILKEIEINWQTVKAKCIPFTTTSVLEDLKKAAKSVTHEKAFSDFLEIYKKLGIVNPTKDKFSDTILNLNYYELLRIFANGLEKENSVLFVMGFSFADEHIREMVLRAANSNPTLLIIIFAFNDLSAESVKENLGHLGKTFKYNNIEILKPEDGNLFNLDGINNAIFKPLLNELEKL